MKKKLGLSIFSDYCLKHSSVLLHQCMIKNSICIIATFHACIMVKLLKTVLLSVFILFLLRKISTNAWNALASAWMVTAWIWLVVSTAYANLDIDCHQLETPALVRHVSTWKCGFDYFNFNVCYKYEFHGSLWLVHKAIPNCDHNENALYYEKKNWQFVHLQRE